MIIKIKRKILRKIELLFFSILFVTFILLGISIAGLSAIGANVTNTTVIAKVNVTNTAPSITKAVITPNPIDLNANGAAVIICNGSFYDGNGYDDVKNVSATLYQNGTAPSAVDDNNNHYTNVSCLPCEVIPGTSNLNGSCACRFAVQYYANPGAWLCNMTINDSGGIVRSENSSFYTLTEVLGIRTENSVLDYGNLSVTQTSSFARMNVTNGGNIPINITLRGFGGSDEEIGRNFTMLCESGSNITWGYHRYYPGNNTIFEQMYNITNVTIQIFNLTVPLRTEDARLGNDSNATFWKLEIPATSSGVCNGTVIFGAIDASN